MIIIMSSYQTARINCSKHTLEQDIRNTKDPVKKTILQNFLNIKQKDRVVIQPVHNKIENIKKIQATSLSVLEQMTDRPTDTKKKWRVDEVDDPKYTKFLKNDV